jgi:hypothetical protein
MRKRCESDVKSMLSDSDSKAIAQRLQYDRAAFAMRSDCA